MNEKRINILKAGMNSCGISSIIADKFYENSAMNALRYLVEHGYLEPHHNPKKVQYWNTTAKGRKAVRDFTGIDNRNLSIGEYDPQTKILYSK